MRKWEFLLTRWGQGWTLRREGFSKLRIAAFEAIPSGVVREVPAEEARIIRDLAAGNPELERELKLQNKDKGMIRRWKKMAYEICTGSYEW